MDEAAVKATSLKEKLHELHQSAANIASLESSNEYLERMMEEAKRKVAESLSENKLLVETK